MRTYSSGMFGRLAFSVAVHLRPEILLIDEALAAGDAAFKLKSMDKILELCEHAELHGADRVARTRSREGAGRGACGSTAGSSATRVPADEVVAGLHVGGEHRSGHQRPGPRRRVVRSGSSLMPELLDRAELAGPSCFGSKRYAMARMSGLEPPVVVFSMGKTGSTAIARRQRDAPGDRVFQIFRLETERLAQAERATAQRPRGDSRRGFDPVRRCSAGRCTSWESELLLGTRRRAAPWTVITTVREPIAQAVSAFFHGGRPAGRSTTGASAEALTADLARRRLGAGAAALVRPGVRPALGIDVFAHPFDTWPATA